jgi:glycosyltransferase involved in cell wall biosynthesis
LQVDPYDVEDMARGFSALETDEALYEALRAAGAAQLAKFSDRLYKDRLAEMYGRVTGASS